MSRLFGRPLLLLPVGAVLLVVGLLVGLNAVGAARWGEVVEAGGPTCALPDQDEMCLLREDVALDGPHFSRRDAGAQWDLQPASGETQEVSLPDGDSDALSGSGVTEAVMLSQPDGDVMGVEADGRTIGSTWVGRYGVLQHVGLGLMVVGLGAGMVVSGWRMKRATDSWTDAASVRRFGSPLVAVPVVLGFVVWLLPRFTW